MFLANVDMMNNWYTCGGTGIEFSGAFPYLVSTLVTLIKVVVPILLIIFGMLDLGKAVIAAKEDEIKKGQQTFIKRVVAAIIVFFVVQVVQIVIRFVSTSTDKTNVVNCFECFIIGTVDDNSCVDVN